MPAARAAAEEQDCRGPELLQDLGGNFGRFLAGFWSGGQAQHGDEVGCGGQDGLVVPARPGAALEVVQPEAVN